MFETVVENRVIDANTKLSSKGQLPKINPVASNLAILVGNTKYDAVVKQNPELINPSQPINVDLSNQDYHHIETNGPPVFSKSRRLTPKILKAIKKEFEYLMSQNTIRPSKSYILQNPIVIKYNMLLQNPKKSIAPVVITVDLIQLLCPISIKFFTFRPTLKISCQRSKVQRHTVSPIQPFASTPERFQYVHVDLVRPLSPSDGFTYLLTCIDRNTRWLDDIPLSDITAETVAKSFIINLVSCFEVPCTRTTDQGRQFQSPLFFRNTTYQNYSIPPFFEYSDPTNPTECLLRLRETFWTLKLTPISCHPSTSCFVHAALNTHSHVFFRVDGLKPSLTVHYQGPFEILSWTYKHFTNKKNDKTTMISIDQLKPAFLLNDTNSTKEPFHEQKNSSSVVRAPRLDSDVPVPTTTLFGRKVRFNPKFLGLLINCM
ncbi:gag-pol polyprotein [Nephila pilipes]|uniref:Gag-pol polyprotein n=1 Tax=Nephila pilipes TaxID=299642 RepID=A0A8X6N250_NEPPI|nr:gag-pol polyprotein [Nephila pilipes]